MAPNPRSIVVQIILAACILASTVAGQTAQPAALKLSTRTAEPVVLNVTVTGSSAYVTDLKATDFEVTIDKKPARVVASSQADGPVSVGILLDFSNPLSLLTEDSNEANFDALEEPIRHFLQSSNQANDYFLIGFNKKPQLLTDWTSEPGSIVNQLRGLRPYGHSALYDACYQAVDKLRTSGHPKRALLLISDGVDRQSHHTLSELRELLRAGNVLVYTMTFQAQLNSPVEMHGAGTLQDLSFISGGRSFLSRGGNRLQSSDASEVFEIIATELRNQYALSVVPTEPIEAEKWHKIKVNVSRSGRSQVKDLSVRTRTSFYAR